MEDTAVILARIDERLKNFGDELEKLTSKMSDEYVTKHEFWPVRAITYGGAGIVLTAVVTAGVALVVRN